MRAGMTILIAACWWAAGLGGPRSGGATAEGQTTAEGQAPAAPRNAAPADDAIDFEKARALFRRRQQGEKLSPADEAYLDRARAARARMAKPDGAAPGGRPRRMLEARSSVGFTPLDEMTADDRYQGQDGGLYGRGENDPPAEHRRAAEAALARIEPLDVEGRPSADGRVGFVSISMSNATQEFSRFQRFADRATDKNRRLTIVDCAQGGQAMAEWTNPDAPAWREADRRLTQAGVSPKQVQVCWIKLANKGPTGELEDHGRRLQRDTERVIQNAKARFPNLRIAYLSSRIYGGYAQNALNPEPYAYESAFATRWLIQDQIAGRPELNADAAKGEVRAPLLLWGPYLWADGEKPRKSDGLKYLREDLASDGTHPSEAGRDKVAQTMLRFFQTHPLAKPWFAPSP